ncbi:MAG: DNA mismatch repair endonuclease MutL [Leptospirales bacterium]
MGQIHELSQSVINQIAAGEVIERPASVVKELVENSLDAGSDRIAVFIEDGGRTSIIVSDNGSGILPEDLPLAFKRHATSKIQKFEDLSVIRSMGFRGEALASIASVSQVSLRSVYRNSTQGYEFRISPSDPGTLSDWSGPSGTTVEVRDLFQNLPVRLKFLKSAATEQVQVVELLSQISLGYPHVQFHLSSNSRPILSLPPRSDRRLRLLDLHQGLYEDDFRTVSLEGDGVSLRAEILRPDKFRKDRRYQKVFLNQRCIKHPALFQAISQGSAGYIQKDVQPGAWIWLDLSPDRVDVNVHPTKREVRFLDPDRLFSLVRRIVREGLEGFSSNEFREDPYSAPSIDPVRTVSEPVSGTEEFSSSVTGFHESPDTSTHKDKESKPPLEGIQKREPVRNPHKHEIPDRDTDRPRSRGGIFRPETGKNDSMKEMFQAIPDLLKSLPPAPFFPKPMDSLSVKILGQVYDTFVLVLIGSELVLVDQHTAHERIRYDGLRKSFSEGRIQSLPYLFPQSVRISSLEIQNLEQRIDELLHLGFDLDIQGPESVKVSAIPVLLEGEDPARLIQELSESSSQFEWPLIRSDRLDETLMTLSCHTSIRANHILGNEDLGRIVRSLLSTEYPYTCPHGRPTVLSLSRTLIEKWFQRS